MSCEFVTAGLSQIYHDNCRMQSGYGKERHIYAPPHNFISSVLTPSLYSKSCKVKMCSVEQRQGEYNVGGRIVKMSTNAEWNVDASL